MPWDPAAHHNSVFWQHTVPDNMLAPFAKAGFLFVCLFLAVCVFFFCPQWHFPHSWLRDIDEYIYFIDDSFVQAERRKREMQRFPFLWRKVRELSILLKPAQALEKS